MSVGVWGLDIFFIYPLVLLFIGFPFYRVYILVKMKGGEFFGILKI